MSAPVKSSIEQPSSAPSFSYAQAAKGKSAASSLDAPVPATPSKTDGASKRAASTDAGVHSQAQAKTATRRAASEGRMHTTNGNPPESVAHTNGVSDDKDAKTPQLANDVDTQKHGSLPPSPELVTLTNPNPSKDEDPPLAVNGSSDSTWDRNSQSSLNAPNIAESRNLDSQPEKDVSASWDGDAPSEPNLKEAPPPSLNIWQQRIETQAAKEKVKQASTSQLPSSKTSQEQEQVSPSMRGLESLADAKRQDKQKRGKPPTEDKAQPENTRSSNRERKPKSGVDDRPSIGVMAPPPPPGDAISWPTPEKATVEDRKKSQTQQKPEEGEKEKEKESQSKSKAGGRKAWTQMDFVPTAVFETHVPHSRRGGRGPSGGRDNPPRGRNNPSNPRGEKPGNISTPSTPQTAADDSRANNGMVATLPLSARSKRASSAGPTSSKEQRKHGEFTNYERSKESTKEDGRTGQARRTSTNETRKVPAIPIPATPQISISSNRSGPFDATASTPSGNLDHRPQPLAAEYSPHTKPFVNGRKGDNTNKPSEYPKEAQQNGNSVRDREDRATRGRGGRGRGGTNHNSLNGAAANGTGYSNGQGFGYQQSFSPPSRSFSNHERTPSQSQSSWYGTLPHRNTRSGSRSQYNQNWVPVGGRFSHGQNTGPPHLPNIQTDLANMQYLPPGPQGVMSAIPYNPYEEQVTVYDMVQMQMEYYVSVDNLCKDMFLRKHMDSQGFVFLSVLAAFNRIVTLTQDIEIIRYVCLNSSKIEFKPGQVWQDGRDRLRTREGWENFVLPKDQRDPTAQTDGPVPASIHTQTDFRAASDEQQKTLQRNPAMNDPAEFPYQSLNAIAPTNASADQPEPVTNGNVPHSNQMPLSAAVSEFSPAAHSHTSRRFASPDTRQLDTKPFADEDIANLQIFVRHSINSQPPPFPSSSSRTFSNGSIDGGNISEELAKVSERQPRSMNGEVFENERSARSRSPFVMNSPNRRSDNGRSPPVFWLKHREQSNAPESSSDQLALEPYPEFRRDALISREQALAGKSIANMQNLYNFWSHFLIRNFNRSMYEEFRQLAVDDQKSFNSNTGMQSLMQYYDEALLGHRAILHDNIARHYVELVQTEDQDGERSAFKRLRSAWRNGAFNHMNRHKILKLIDSGLKNELDR